MYSAIQQAVICSQRDIHVRRSCYAYFRYPALPNKARGAR